MTTIKKDRSPAYPYYSLEKCVRLVELFYKANGLAKAPRDNAMKHMGLNPDKAWDFRATSSITGYGLLDEKGSKSKRTFQLSDLGKTVVIIKESTGEKRDALRKAALNYEIIKSLADNFPNGLPADDVIKLNLVKDYGFTERAASRFVDVLKNTYTYADLGSKVSGFVDESDMDNFEDYSDDEVAPPEKPKPGYKTSLLTLSYGLEVSLSHPDKMSKSNFDFMILWINHLGLVDEKADNEIPF